MRKLFDVLTKNLRVAEGLVYVYQFNAVSWEQEVEFICGDQDLLQWQVGPGRGWCRHLTLHCCRHGTPAYREPR